MDSLLKLIFSIIGTIGLIATVGGCVYALVNPRIRAVVKVAWKAAFRFRVFWVMAVLLVVSVGVIPLIVKGDGTAEGLTQVLVTYTLTMITAVLATGVLWLSVGTLARDIGESHIQMIAVKPIARWQIILGKWVGVMSLNLLLLAVGGAVVYGLVEYRANKLTWDRLEELEPRSDLEIAQMALETGRQIFVLEEGEDGRIVGVQPTKKDQPLLSELAQSEIGRGNNLPNLLARYRVRRAEALERLGERQAALADAGQYLVEQQPVRVERRGPLVHQHGPGSSQAIQRRGLERPLQQKVGLRFLGGLLRPPALRQVRVGPIDD